MLICNMLTSAIQLRHLTYPKLQPHWATSKNSSKGLISLFNFFYLKEKYVRVSLQYFSPSKIGTTLITINNEKMNPESRRLYLLEINSFRKLLTVMVEHWSLKSKLIIPDWITWKNIIVWLNIKIFLFQNHILRFRLF